MKLSSILVYSDIFGVVALWHQHFERCFYCPMVLQGKMEKTEGLIVLNGRLEGFWQVFQVLNWIYVFNNFCGDKTYANGSA